MRKTLLTFALTAMALPTLADETQMTENARQTAMQLIKLLGGELQKQMSSGGPESAISVCKEKAPAIAGEMSRSTGWRVTRVSLKTRNPLLGTPDEWEQGVLKLLEQRLAAGAKPETLEFAQIVDEPAGKFFRYMKALPVQPVCTTCHGGADYIPEGVKARLAAEYPHDKATGYSPGMIRGGISIKRPL